MLEIEAGIGLVELRNSHGVNEVMAATDLLTLMCHAVRQKGGETATWLEFDPGTEPHTGEDAW